MEKGEVMKGNLATVDLIKIAALVSLRDICFHKGLVFSSILFLLQYSARKKNKA